MKIEFDTGDTSPNELSAVIALCASLGGRLPTVAQTRAELAATVREELNERAHNGGYTLAEEKAAPAPAPSASEAMLAAEAARVEEGDGTDPKQLDADGIPWDERIHSGNPTLTADGRWRKKRGVSEVYYGQIHAELTGTGTTSNETAQNGSPIAETPKAPPPPVSPAPTVSAAEPVPNAPTPTPAPPAPTAAPSAPAENASVAGNWPDYASFVQAVSAIRSPTIPYAELNDIAQALGLVKFIDLRDRADLWTQFYGMAGGQ